MKIERTGHERMNKYFSSEEIKGLNSELVDKLTTARIIAGVPFIITSGLRTQDQNVRSQGVSESSHLTGKAVDLHVEDGIHRFKMVKGALEAGFVRLGIYDRHLHLDLDETKPQNVIWVGVSQ